MTLLLRFLPLQLLFQHGSFTIITPAIQVYSKSLSPRKTPTPCSRILTSNAKHDLRFSPIGLVQQENCN